MPRVPGRDVEVGEGVVEGVAVGLVVAEGLPAVPGWPHADRVSPAIRAAAPGDHGFMRLVNGRAVEKFRLR